MKTTKSPRKVLRMSYLAAQDALPPYSHPSSPHKFTQHQLLACLVLKEFLRLDYRGIRALLLDTPSLRQTIDLEQVPHWTTMQKAADRLLKKKPRIGSWIRSYAAPSKPASSVAARA